MSEDLKRDLGPQPLSQLMQGHGLAAHDLVEASPTQLTYKMVARACKGRRLTKKTKAKIRIALQVAAGEQFAMDALFNY